PRCTVNTPSGPDLSGLALPSGFNATPANSPRAINVMLLSRGSTISIWLLLRSARKYFLSFGSNQLISKETSAFVPGLLIAVVTLKASVSWAKAGPATANIAMAPIAIPATRLFFDRNLRTDLLIAFSPCLNLRLCTTYDSPRVKVGPFEARKEHRSYCAL